MTSLGDTNGGSRIVYIREKLAHEHAQNTTCGLSTAASLFKLTGWFHIHLFSFIKAQTKKGYTPVRKVSCMQINHGMKIPSMPRLFMHETFRTYGYFEAFTTEAANMLISMFIPSPLLQLPVPERFTRWHPCWSLAYVASVSDNSRLLVNLPAKPYHVPTTGVLAG